MTKQYSILYIEDNPDNRILIQRFLEFEGFKVHFAATGWAGVRASTKILPDVFLIDLNLPDISGFEVIDILNRQPQTQAIPKIAFSADGGGKIKRLQAAGPTFFLKKPVNVDTLAQKITHAILNPNDVETFVL